MSGGHFDYQQYHINDIADGIERYLNGVELDDYVIDDYINDRYLDDDEKQYIKEHHHTMPNPYGLSDETLSEFRAGLSLLRQAAIYAQRIDWLLSGDDGEEEFHTRLKEELEELSSKIKKG